MTENRSMFFKSPFQIYVSQGHRRHALSHQQLRIMYIGSNKALIPSFFIGAEKRHVSNINRPVLPNSTIIQMIPPTCPPAHGRHILVFIDEDVLRGRLISINTHPRNNLRVPIYLRWRLWALSRIFTQWDIRQLTTPVQFTMRAGKIVHLHALEDYTTM